MQLECTHDPNSHDEPQLDRERDDLGCSIAVSLAGESGSVESFIVAGLAGLC